MDSGYSIDYMTTNRQHISSHFFYLLSDTFTVPRVAGTSSIFIPFLALLRDEVTIILVHGDIMCTYCGLCSDLSLIGTYYIEDRTIFVCCTITTAGLYLCADTNNIHVFRCSTFDVEKLHMH